MAVDTDDELRSILKSADRITVIGASTTPGKAAHDVPKYLLDAGYDLVPVNPFAEAVHGQTAYDDIASVPGPIEVLEVFRPSEEVSDIVDAAIDRGDVETIWLQLGIRNDEAVARARDAGIAVVQDRCMKVEHRRLLT